MITYHDKTRKDAIKYQYRYIRAWGIMMHSYEYYIRDQIELARKDKAPEDAIFKDIDGVWYCYSNMDDSNPHKDVVAAIHRHLLLK